MAWYVHELMSVSLRVRGLNTCLPWTSAHTSVIMLVFLSHGHLCISHTHTEAPRAVGALVSVSECLERLESV